MAAVGSMVSVALALVGTAPPSVPVQRPTVVAPSTPAPAPPVTAAPTPAPPVEAGPGPTLVPDPAAPTAPIATVPDPVAPAPEPSAAIPPGVPSPSVEASPEPAELEAVGPTEAPMMAAPLETEVSPPPAEFDTTDLSMEPWRSLDDSHSRDVALARTMVAGGALSGVAALMMLIASGIERNKPACDFGLSDCADAPRRGVAAGLGVAGGVLLAGGAALVTVGVVRLRRLKVGATVDGRSAMLRVGGRF